MKNKVAQLLSEHGPMLSGKLARHYEKKHNASNEAARKALSRADKPVCKIHALTFDKNQKFFYLESQFNSQQYTSALLRAIEGHSRTNSIYISAFAAQNGYVSKELLPAFVASPIKNVKGHKLHGRVIKDLTQQEIICEFDETRWMLAPKFSSGIAPNISRSAGLEIAKKQIINDFDSWIGKMNLAAYNCGFILNREAQFANFQWAYTAPSYAHPLYDMKNQRSGFIVADVFYGRTATVQDIRFFIDKVSVIRSFKNLPDFLPIFIVDRIALDALKQLKDNKIMIAIIDNIFGNRYSELLGEIVNMFANATAIISKNPEKMETLFTEIGKAEGRFNTLAGDMFELLVGHYYQTVGCNWLKMQETVWIPDKNKNREVDVLVMKDGHIYVAECKATRSMIDVEFVEKWLGEIIPQIRKSLLEKYTETNNHVFQLWSLGGFTSEAMELLQTRKESTTKYKIEFFNKEQMHEMAKKNNVRFFSTAIDQHFIGHS